MTDAVLLSCKSGKLRCNQDKLVYRGWAVIINNNVFYCLSIMTVLSVPLSNSVHIFLTCIYSTHFLLMLYRSGFSFAPAMIQFNPIMSLALL